MLNVVLCGAGYRDRNLLRVLHQNPGFHVRCVADQSEEAREAAQRIAPGIRTVAEAQAAIDEPDLAFVTLHYPSGRVAHLNLSRMSPVKQRRIAVGGSAGMAVWDDLKRYEPLKIYELGITVLPQNRREIIVPGYRVGEMSSPRLCTREPLAEAVEHFRCVIQGEEACRSPGEQGLRIVWTLERAQGALDRSLSEVTRRRGRATQAHAVAAE